MIANDEKLRIAIEALLALRALPDYEPNYAYHACQIVDDALSQIKRKHYLGEPLPVVVVNEILTGSSAVL